MVSSADGPGRSKAATWAIPIGPDDRTTVVTAAGITQVSLADAVPLYDPV